jgi:hypothetical protein
MPRYHFNLRSPDTRFVPGAGQDLPNLAAAMAEAHHAARALVRSRMRHHCSTPCGSLDIEDERRQPVARIMLAEVARQIS